MTDLLFAIYDNPALQERLEKIDRISSAMKEDFIRAWHHMLLELTTKNPPYVTQEKLVGEDSLKKLYGNFISSGTILAEHIQFVDKEIAEDKKTLFQIAMKVKPTHANAIMQEREALNSEVKNPQLFREYMDIFKDEGGRPTMPAQSGLFFDDKNLKTEAIYEDLFLVTQFINAQGYDTGEESFVYSMRLMKKLIVEGYINAGIASGEKTATLLFEEKVEKPAMEFLAQHFGKSTYIR